MTEQEYIEVYKKYDEMFNEEALCTLPDIGDANELYVIMQNCIMYGKDAVDMGYSKERAGLLQHIKEDGTVEYFDA